MRRLLLVLASSVALSAWGQAGVEQSSPEYVGRIGVPGAVTTVGDGSAAVRSFQVPAKAPGSLLPVEPSDLENMTGGQAGCPVQVVTASFTRRAELMLPARGNSGGGPTLRIEYRNSSAKDIASVMLTGWIKVKDSPYQLDSVAHPFQLELSRKALLGRDVEATQALKLAGDAVGLDRVEVSRVLYADGTAWRPVRRSCVYRYMGSTERAEAR